MGLADTTPLSGLTWTVGIALFTAQLYPRDTNGYLPAYSELFCWGLLLTFYHLRPRFADIIWKDGIVLCTPPRYLWVVAAAITVTTMSFSVESNAWIAPAVTPTLIALRQTSFLPRFQHPHAQSLRSIWLPVGAAASMLAIAPAPTQTKLICAALGLLGLVALYAYLIRIFESDDQYIGDATQSRISQLVHAIALRALCTHAALVMTLVVVSWPQLSPKLVKAFFAGSVKAAHWIAVFQITQEVPWEIATTMWTCAAGSREAFAASTHASLGLLQTSTRLMVAIAAVYQTIELLPRTSRGRHFLYLFAVWPVFSLVHHTPLSSRIPVLSGEIWTSPPLTPEHRESPRHPIEQLVLNAQVDFALRIEKQSKTLGDAEKEYRRRYAREPPPGFEKWFAYAQSKNSLFIDNFDMINNDMQPFRKISSQRMREGIDHVTSFEHLALRKCGFTGGEYHGQGGGWIVEDLGRLLSEVSRDIPDVEFAFDVVDEPRVVITQQMLDSGGVAKPEFVDESHKSIWRRVTAACPTLKNVDKPAVHDYNISFVQDWTQAKDVCLHPEFEYIHGLFSSPATCMLTDAPIPVLSQAAPSSFGDVMYPSPWYVEKEDQGNYKDEEDPAWEQKANTLYWAGSTTGSHSTNGIWKYSHRQRFVKLVQTLNETSHKYLKQLKPGVWASYQAVEDHSHLFDVKLTAVIQCDDKDCEEQKEFFDLSDREEGNRQFQSRFVFDADGNSFSGRYYTLLRSRSVVLKQTVLREWHDERLVPWVHYIPVSLSMEELPEIMRYMTSNDEGRRIAKEIADAGREWHARVLRREDFTVYLYRLMLELARVMDPQRVVA